MIFYLFLSVSRKNGDDSLINHFLPSYVEFLLVTIYCVRI